MAAQASRTAQTQIAALESEINARQTPPAPPVQAAPPQPAAPVANAPAPTPASQPTASPAAATKQETPEERHARELRETKERGVAAFQTEKAKAQRFEEAAKTGRPFRQLADGTIEWMPDPTKYPHLYQQPQAPQAPAPAQPAAPQGPTPQEAEFRKEFKSTYGEDGLAGQEAWIRRICDEQIEKFRQRLQQDLQPYVQQIDVLSQGLGKTQDAIQQKEILSFEQMIASRHPDWRELLNSPDFQMWLTARGRRSFLMVFPESDDDGGSVDEVSDLFQRYKESDPVFAAQQRQQVEADRIRQAAAAAVTSDTPAATVQMGGDQKPAVLLSDVLRRQAAAKNPRDHMAIAAEAELAQSEGRLFDDRGGTPVPMTPLR
jgi:hypothetical protein